MRQRENASRHDSVLLINLDNKLLNLTTIKNPIQITFMPHHLNHKQFDFALNYELYFHRHYQTRNHLQPMV
ncbi:hypothetical protein Hanom_Chr03g00271691 [Helianthus anomalus]